MEILKNKNKFVEHVIRKSKANNDRIPKREVECIYYLLLGMSAKQIGQKMMLSYRTVEAYISSVKNRLRCLSKSELIEKVLHDLF